MIKKMAIYFFVFIFSFQLWALECKQQLAVNKSQRYDCHVKTEKGLKNFHVLKLNGSFQEISHDHFYLMAPEVSTGVVAGVLERLNGASESVTGFKRQILGQLLECFSKNLTNSVTIEFLEGLQESAKGYFYRYQELGLEPVFTVEDIILAGLSTEMGNLFDGIKERFESDKLGAANEVLNQCGINVPAVVLTGILGSILVLGPKFKGGCLGFVVPKEMSESELGLIHARNFDSDFIRFWNHHPVLVLVEEPGHLKYMATGSAGVIFPAGISGVNEAGISVSLHQMSTTKVNLSIQDRNGFIAPFLQQVVLREARSIDEAINIVKNAGRFASWTILISDAKTGESASIEFSGERVQVSQREKQKPLGQTNHFLGSQMQDQFFYYSVPKFFETHSRMEVISKAFYQMKTPVHLEWAIDQLASHEDYYAGLKSFGRTAVKAYNVMSTISLPEKNQMWFTVGEKNPAAHSTFVGVQVDWNNLNFELIGSKRTRAYENKPNWEESLSHFINARELYHLNKPFDALKELEQAQQLAMKDGIYEIPYHFMTARVWQSVGGDFMAHDKLFEIWNNHRDALKTYMKYWVPYLIARNIEVSDLRYDFKLRKDRDSLLEIAQKEARKLKQEFQHRDLDQVLDDIEVLLKIKHPQGTTAFDVPKLKSLDFITIE